MGLLDRLLGRRAAEPEVEPVTAAPPIRDAEAVDRYERMLRTAPPDVIERAHVEAFARLTTAQLDVLFERFTASAAADDERPADAQPESLARSAARAERRRPGSIAQTLDDTQARAETNTFAGAAILDAVIWYSLASVAWSTWAQPDDAPGGPVSNAFDPGDTWDPGIDG